MSNFFAYCKTCNHRFRFEPEGGGEKPVCPLCWREVEMEKASGAKEEPVRLQVRRDVLVSGVKACPVCETALTEASGFCPKCGYEEVSGTTFVQRQMAREETRRRIRHWIGGGVAALAAAALWFVFFNTERGGAMRQRLVSRWNGAAAQAERETALRAGYDRSCPPWNIGVTVVVRRATGQISRGVLESVSSAQLVLRVGGGQEIIPLSELDETSRAACDPVFRQRWLDQQVRRSRYQKKG